MDKVDEALDAIEKYIEDGSPLPSTKSPYWEASESVPIVRSELARLRVERDELRAALEEIKGMYASAIQTGRYYLAVEYCFNIARAALSCTEGVGIPGEES